MFVPGDPIEQRKRALIAKMAGRGRGGQAGGGFKVGRPAGAGYGRGIGFGAAGGQGNRALALPQMLAGYGQDQGGYGGGAQEAPQAPQFSMTGDNMGGGDIQPYLNPQVMQQVMGSNGPNQFQAIPQIDLLRALGQYGSQPQAQPAPQYSGMHGNLKYF